MRKTAILLILISSLLIPALLSASVNYLSDQEYKKLSKAEREQYWNDLNNEIANLQKRKTEANNQSQTLDQQISDLEKQIRMINNEIAVMNQKLQISDAAVNDFRARVQKLKNELTDWEKLSDSQLWEKQKEFTELNERISLDEGHSLAKLPEFKKDFTDIRRRYNAINESMNKIQTKEKPAYYEDNYQVKKGDYLSKISGYSFIYGDPNKWGIIYRANRDQIADPNVVSEGMDLKIPRGLPGSWKVYKGESLWKISSYPEVYGKGSKWTHIYRANKDQIKDPNLIYPEQIFSIPRD